MKEQNSHEKVRKCAAVRLAFAPFPRLARTWTDNQGHTVVGEFDRVVKGRVLINIGDRTIQVPFGHLITEDQDFVREQLKAHGLQDQVAAKKKTADADATTEDKSAARESSAKETTTDAQTKLGPTRTWTDVLGRTMQARFLGMDSGNVRLQINGKNTSYPFDKFSPADQQYVRGEMVARGEGDKVPAAANVQPAPAKPPPVMPRGGPANAPWNTDPAVPHFMFPTFTPPAEAAPAQPPPEQPAPVEPSPEQASPDQPAPVIRHRPRGSIRRRLCLQPCRISANNLPNNQPQFQQVVVKKCSACGREVPSNLTAGDSCPDRGVYFEHDDSGGQGG